MALQQRWRWAMLATLLLLALMVLLARPEGIAEARPRKAGRKRGSRGKRVPTYNPHAIEGDFDDDEFESAGIAAGASAFDQEDDGDDEREEKEEDDDEISADEEISAQLKEDLELVEYELEELEDEQTHDDGDRDDDSDFDDEDFADLDAEQKRQSASTMRRKKELRRKQAELMKRQKEINARSKRHGKRENNQGSGAGRTPGTSGKSGEEGLSSPKKGPAAPKEKSFGMEMTFVGLIGLYGFVYLYGGAVNAGIAARWEKKFADFFAKHFQVPSEESVADGMLFTKEGSDDYVQYSSGRKNCHGMVVRMSLMPRHDLISLLFAMLDADGGDMVKMEVIVDKQGVKPFVFALVPAKKAKKIQKSTDDLRNFGKKAAFAGLPESHIVLTDCPEILPQILTKDALSVINRAAEDGVLHSVHFTDQNTAAGEDDGMKSTASLSFKFRLPKGAQSVDKLEEIVALAIKYIDVCHDVSIPASVRERNLKKRKEVVLSIVKENSRERAAKKREEDMRRKDEKFKQLTPAQQAKAMEREERRRRKKMMKSGKIKILR